MSVATTTAIAIGAGVAAAGSIGGAAISAHASGKAASQQQKGEQSALNFAQQEWNQQQQNMAPYLAAGKSNLAQLESALPSLTKPFDPSAAGLPSKFSYNAQDFQQDPGYAFALAQGQKAIQNSAASRGGDISGGTLKALDAYTVGMADQDYGAAYNRALGTYQDNYANAASTYYNNQNGAFSKLSSLAGMGQNAAATLGQEGQQFVNSASNAVTGAANAAAAGTVGSANAWNQGLSGATGAITNSLMLNQLLNGQGGSLGGTNNGSGYSVGQQLSAGQGLSTNMASVSPAQWSAYDLGSTPAGFIDANGNPIQ